MPTFEDIQRWWSAFNDAPTARRVVYLLFPAVLIGVIVYIITKAQKELSNEFGWVVLFSVALVAGMYLFALGRRVVRTIGLHILVIGALILLLHPYIQIKRGGTSNLPATMLPVDYPLAPFITDTPTITPTPTGTSTQTFTPTNTTTPTLTPSLTPSVTPTPTPSPEPLCFTDQWKLFPKYLSPKSKDQYGCWDLTQWGLEYEDSIQVYINPKAYTGHTGVYRELSTQDMAIRFRIQINELEAHIKGEINHFYIGLASPDSFETEGALLVFQNSGPGQTIYALWRNRVLLSGIRDGDEILGDCSISDLRGFSCTISNINQPQHEEITFGEVNIEEEWRNFYIGYMLTEGSLADVQVYDLEIIEEE